MNPSARVAAFALLCSLPLLAGAQGGTILTLKKPGAAAPAVEQPAEPAADGVHLPADKDLRAIRSLALRAGAFVAAYRPGVRKPTFVDADAAFRMWQQEKKRRYSEKDVVEMLGAWLGEQMVADLDMEWVVVRDRNGTDYAVRAKQQELMAFPFASVEKRVEDREHDFLEAVYYTAKQTLRGGEAANR